MYPYDNNGQATGGLLGMWGGQPAPKNMSMADVVSGNPGFLAGVTALSMLANNNGRRSFGQLLGRGGLDALGALGNAGMYGLQRDRMATQDALARAQWEASRADRGLANAISLGQFQLAQQKLGLAQQQMQRDAAERNLYYGLMGINPYSAPSLTGNGQGDMDPLKMPRIPDAPAMPAGTLPPKSQRPAGPDGAPLDKAAMTNNPGNVGNFGDQVRVYPSILDGLKAMRANLLSPAYAQNPTVAAIISRWSPSNENDTSALIKDTAAMMGVDPNQPLDLNDPQTMKNLMRAITVNEGSYKYVPADEFDMAVGLKSVPAGYRSVDYRGNQQAQNGMPYSGGSGGISPNPMAAASLPGELGAAAGRVLGLQQQQEKNDLDRKKFDFEREKASPGYLFNQKLAEKSADYYDSLNEDAAAKDEMITNAETLKSLIANLKSGPLQDKIDLANQFLHKIGLSGNLIGANDVRDADALQYLINKNVFNVLLEQKGAASDKDSDNARKTFVRLENSPEGANWIAQYMFNIATLGKEKDMFLIDQMRKNGGDRYAAMRAWDKYKKTLPSVVPPAPERVTRTSASASATSPSGGRHYRYDPATRNLVEK